MTENATTESTRETMADVDHTPRYHDASAQTNTMWERGPSTDGAGVETETGSVAGSDPPSGASTGDVAGE